MLRMKTGFIMEYCKLSKYMRSTGLIAEALCRFCLEKDKSAKHMLSFLLLGKEKPSIESYLIEPMLKLKSLAR